MKLGFHLPPISRKLAINLGVIWVFIVGAIVFLVLFGQGVMAKKTEVDQLELTVADLESKNALLKKNTALSDQDIDTFNKMSTKLVPAEESYFSLISAVEQLSARSGFQLSDYNIDLSTAPQDKISITVEGAGDIDDFLRFLELYNFSGGRLVTVEQFDVPLTEQESYSLVLNFYHNRATGESAESEEQPIGADVVPVVEGAAPALTDKDINFVKNVLDKTLDQQENL